MPKAVLKDGLIYPLERLPSEWRNGQELRVEAAETEALTEAEREEIDRSFDELERMCAQGDPEDDERLRIALEEAHRIAKEQMRRRMGLPE